MNSQGTQQQLDEDDAAVYVRDMRQHTPGPWCVDADGVTVRTTMLRPPVQIAHCGSPTSAYAQANARLIAAAPEMLEILEDLSWHNHGRSREILDRIRKLAERLGYI